MRAAWAGPAETAVMAMTLVCATSAAVTDGALPSLRRTALVTGALVTSCSMVCTSVGVTGCCGGAERAGLAGRLHQDLGGGRVLLRLGERDREADRKPEQRERDDPPFPPAHKLGVGTKSRIRAELAGHAFPSGAWSCRGVTTVSVLMATLGR